MEKIYQKNTPSRDNYGHGVLIKNVVDRYKPTIEVYQGKKKITTPRFIGKINDKVIVISQIKRQGTDSYFYIIENVKDGERYSVDESEISVTAYKDTEYFSLEDDDDEYFTLE